MTTDNDKFLSFLFEEMKGNITIFIGAGASIEGETKGGEKFPRFYDIQKGIILDFGSDEQRETMASSGGKIDFEMFLNVVDELNNEGKGNSVLRERLAGNPGLAHYQLAAAVVSGGSRLFLNLTTNYDELFDKAMREICGYGSVDFKVYSPEQIESPGIGHLVRDLPVLIKLFGDLGIYHPRFRELELLEIIIGKQSILRDYLKQPVLFIGYSFSDKNLRDVLLKEGGPVYVVDPTPLDLKTSRKVRQFRGTFGEFMTAFLEKSKSRQTEMYAKIDELLRHVEPEAKFRRFAEVEPLVHALNDRGFGTVEDRFFLKVEDDRSTDQHFLVERREAARWIDGFLASPSPLMLLLGESGLGKSCFLYMIATKPRDDLVVSFFAGATLVGANDLFGRISTELSVAPEKIKTLFQHLDGLLSRETAGRKWLIVIDGLNECPDHGVLLEQILTIAAWDLAHIKILYSCRTVFWETIREANLRLEKLHYGGWSCGIDAFTPEEAEEAYDKYRQRLRITTRFQDIEPRVRAYMATPLMMRMIVLTYPGEKLLEYIPATTVFDTYWTHLTVRSENRNSVLNMDVLKILSEHKVRHICDKSVNHDDIFHLDDFIGNAFVTSAAIRAWRDEGILVWLDEKEQRFRFSLDRFYEYCLAKILMREHRKKGQGDIVAWVVNKNTEFASIGVHFSYHESLKSVLINSGLQDERLQLRGLVELIPAYSHRVFAQQCLRQLLFETDQPVIEAIEQVIADCSGSTADVFLEAELTLAANSPKIIPSAMRGIFGNDDARAHRCIQLLLSLGREHLPEIVAKGLEHLRAATAMDEQIAKGLVNLHVLFFCAAGKNEDPMHALQKASASFFEPVLDFPNFRDIVTGTLKETVQRWGPYLFSTTSRNGESPFSYPWTRMGTPERVLALRVGQAIGKEFVDFNTDDLEAIRFFTMEIPQVDQMNGPRPAGLPQEYPIESLMGRWVFIRHGATHFNDIVNILDTFMRTNDFCTADFCIGVLTDILTMCYTPRDPEYQRGYERLSAWVEYFKTNIDGFFDVLNREDAFTNTYNPLDETAMIFAHLNPSAPSNTYIDQWIHSDDMRCRKLGLLAIRRLWKETGKQALVSARALFLSDAPDIHAWLNGIMKEVSLTDRRLFEQALDGFSLPPSRLSEIENTEPRMARSSGFSMDSLAWMLFGHGRGRIRKVTEWHRKIHESASLDAYLDSLVTEILDWQVAAYLDRQPAFSDP